jgi:hypothetical protein
MTLFYSSLFASPFIVYLAARETELPARAFFFNIINSAGHSRFAGKKAIA